MIKLNAKNFPKTSGLYVMRRKSGSFGGLGDVHPVMVYFDSDRGTLQITGTTTILSIKNKNSVPADTLFSDQIEISR